MAKIEMICPFSNKPCKECPLYKGRHYYLCFEKKYRGFLGDKEGRVEQKPTSTVIKKKFEMPPVLKPSPTWLIFDDFAEGGKK